MECKLLHCEYRASRGVDYQTMPLQCIVLSGSIYSQHAIELILVSQNTRLESDSNDSRIMCILCKTKKLSILFTFLSEREQSIDKVFE